MSDADLSTLRWYVAIVAFIYGLLLGADSLGLIPGWMN